MTKFVISQNAILGDVMWGVLIVVNQYVMGGGKFCDISQNDFGGGEMLSYREYFSNFADEICEVRLHLGNLKNNKI